MNKIARLFIVVLCGLIAVNPVMGAFTPLGYVTARAGITFGGAANNPPTTPAAPSGPATGTINTTYEYSATTTDPDGDQIQYVFAWGDGKISTTTFLSSGTTGTSSHQWISTGTYSVSVNALDSRGLSSAQSNPLYVTITSTGSVNQPPIQLPQDTVVSGLVTAGDGGTISLPDGLGAQTTIEIPAGALNTDTSITISKVDVSNVSQVPNGTTPAPAVRPVAAYEFLPSGLLFNKTVTIKLVYSDADQDGIVDGTNINEKDLGIMWWDGYIWRYIGGNVDTTLNVVTAQVQHFTIYALFPVSALTDDAFRPKEKIITPALADGVNDIANFGGIVAGDVINIYDVNGKRVRQIQDENIWDGKNDNGDIVKGGIYIYQIKKQDKTISGTIVVAK
jgi:hypothetical protein